jgi:sialate O-acetylesterase
MEKDGATIRLHFKHTGSGLAMKGSKLETFELCGSDGVYYPADAMIEKNVVVASSRYVKEPAHLRYAWADNPEDANLYNSEGLPASPFKTN